MKKTVVATFLFTAFLFSANAQDQAVKIHWMSFEEAVALNKTAPRKLFIDVYTEWCG